MALGSASVAQTLKSIHVYSFSAGIVAGLPILFFSRGSSRHARRPVRARGDYMVKRWEHFAHEADMGIRGFGATRDEAFEQAAIGMIAVITDPTNVISKDVIDISCEAPDDEFLLADWLNAIVYEMATRRFLFSHFEVYIANGHLQAHVWGEPIDIGRHQPAVEVKGATYTELHVGNDADGWVAQCVVDI